MDSKRSCAVVQLRPAESVPQPTREVSDFAPGLDWKGLAERLSSSHFDALVVAWALRALVGVVEAPIPWSALRARTGFTNERLAQALAELRSIEVIAIGRAGLTVRLRVSVSFLTWFYERRAMRQKGGRS